VPQVIYHKDSVQQSLPTDVKIHYLQEENHGTY
jgi:hypothetical protein